MLNFFKECFKTTKNQNIYIAKIICLKLEYLSIRVTGKSGIFFFLWQKLLCRLTFQILIRVLDNSLKKNYIFIVRVKFYVLFMKVHEVKKKFPPPHHAFFHLNSLEETILKSYNLS